MKVIKVISENKKTKRRYPNGSKTADGFQAKIGYAEVIVEENGKLRTRHMVEVK